MESNSEVEVAGEPCWEGAQKNPGGRGAFGVQKAWLKAQIFSAV